MNWAALTSGGKDSILAVQKALDAGIPVDALVTVRPKNPHSYMFHTSNLDAVPVIARVAGMKYVEIRSRGEEEREVYDLAEGLRLLGIEGIVTGAVASEYQRGRIQGICDRLRMELFCPLWHMDPESLLRDVAQRLHAIIVVTAADGLDESFLGQRIDDALVARLMELSRTRRIHPAGEGGEYESLALNAPFYGRPVTYTTDEVRRAPGRSELVLGGFT